MAEYNGYTGVWRRLKSGAAIFIRDGEDIKSAVRRSFRDYQSGKMRVKEDKLIDKERDLEYKARAQSFKKDVFLEKKGMLSKEYEDAEQLERTYRKARVDAYYERMELEDKRRMLERINKKGFQVKKDQVEELKQVGQTKKSLSDLRKAVKEYNDKKGKDGSISLKSEIELGEQKNRFADKYGYESMKDETARAYTDIEKDKFGTYQPGQKVMVEDSYGGKPIEAEVVREMNETDSKMLYGNAVRGYVVKNQYGEFNSNNRRMSAKENVSKTQDYRFEDGRTARKGDVFSAKDADAYDIKDLQNDGIDIRKDDKLEIVSKATDGYYDVRNQRTGKVIEGLSESHLGIKKADTDKYKAEVSRTPKQRAAAIDKANKSISALNEIERLAGNNEYLLKKGKEMGLKEFKEWLKKNPGYKR